MSSEQISTGPGLYMTAPIRAPYPECNNDTMVSSRTLCRTFYKKDANVESELLGLGPRRPFRPLETHKPPVPLMNNSGVTLHTDTRMRENKRETSVDCHRMASRTFYDVPNTIPDKELYLGTSSRIVHRYG